MKENINELVERENELRKMSSKKLLQMYGEYKLFQGDVSNDASPVAWDIDIDCKLIYHILLERLKGMEVE